MVNNKRVNDEYTNRARKEGYLARSAYKLEEIDKKYHILDGATRVLDIGCAPGSWLQYISKKLEERSENRIIGFDLKEVGLLLPGVHTYVQDISDREGVQSILDAEEIEQFDVIVSDMAPDTIGNAEIDALRSINLIEKTLRIYDRYLKSGGTFAIKVFMGPGFQELVRDLKAQYGASNIVTFKPRACRKASKETYIIKRS